MSGSEDSGKPLDNNSLAFKYVAGTLATAEKRLFETALSNDETLRETVQFWETQLIKLNPEEEREPSPQTWDKIAAAIQPSADKAEAPNNQGFDWKSFWQWGSPSFAAIALMFVMFGYDPTAGTQTPPKASSELAHSEINADYVAVLTDTEGNAVLTALSSVTGKELHFKWEALIESADSQLQLWAISKRDGEARPITVFANASIEQLNLNTTQWRLITDAAFLILSKEEPGGSAIDEPSEWLLAKGVCVRFSKNNG